MGVFREIIKRNVVSRGKSTKKEIIPIINPLIIKEIENAQCYAIAWNLENVHPNLELINRMIKLTADYIREKKRIIYGGTAIEAYLNAKGITIKKDVSKYLDYDFYTPNNEYDSIQIANKYQEADMKYARRVLAIHPETYRISAEFTKEFIADATFVPENVYNKLPKNQIGELLYIDPQFLKIDLYTSVSNPHINVYRWDKSFKRLMELEALYPLPQFNDMEIKSSNIDSKIQKIFDKYSQNNDNIIIVSAQAVNLYIKLVLNQEIKILSYAFYTTEPEKEALLIQTKLKKNKSIKTKITNHHKYLDIFPKMTRLSDDKGNVIAEWYNIATDCISITKLSDYSVANYHWLLRFLYGKYNIAMIENENFHYYGYLIQTLMKAYNEYYKMEKTHKRDSNNPFKILQTDCITNPDYKIPKINKNWDYKPDKNKNTQTENITTNYNNDMLAEIIIS
jgi:hypothetical protein